VALHSSLAGFDDKTQRMAHWLLNPLTGKAWGFAEAVAINFDLDARKAIPIAEAAKPVLQQHLRPGMRFGD
jgi:acyl-CoA thioester hydrolase